MPWPLINVPSPLRTNGSSAKGLGAEQRNYHSPLEEIDRMKEFSQPFCLRLADRPQRWPATERGVLREYWPFREARAGVASTKRLRLFVTRGLMDAVRQLVPTVGVESACEALGVARASFYRQPVITFGRYCGDYSHVKAPEGPTSSCMPRRHQSSYSSAIVSTTASPLRNGCSRTSSPRPGNSGAVT